MSHPASNQVGAAKERPILFSGSMVRALLSGSKTQTRRVVKLANGQYIPPSKRADVNGWNQLLRNCPYGQPGDRLWVRENGWERPERTPKMMREGADTWERYYFDADGYDNPADAAELKGWGFKRRPSIHMPRWASRILLEVTDVRVERLQDCSEADAQAEGAESRVWNDIDHDIASLIDWPLKEVGNPYRNGYALLWDQINGAGAWELNPWVWAVSFRMLNEKGGD